MLSQLFILSSNWNYSRLSLRINASHGFLCYAIERELTACNRFGLLIGLSGLEIRLKFSFSAESLKIQDLAFSAFDDARMFQFPLQ